MARFHPHELSIAAMEEHDAVLAVSFMSGSGILHCQTG